MFVFYFLCLYLPFVRLISSGSLSSWTWNRVCLLHILIFFKFHIFFIIGCFFVILLSHWWLGVSQCPKYFFEWFLASWQMFSLWAREGLIEVFNELMALFRLNFCINSHIILLFLWPEFGREALLVWYQNFPTISWSIFLLSVGSKNNAFIYSTYNIIEESLLYFSNNRLSVKMWDGVRFC